MTVEKLSSGKAVVECRYNPVRGRWRVHIAVGKRRIAPLLVPAPEDEADKAARLALARAVKSGQIDVDDIGRDDGAIIVERQSAKRPAGATKGAAKMSATPRRRTKAKLEVPARNVAKAEHSRREVASKAEPSLEGMTKAQKNIGNGEETGALESEYRAAKKTYHMIGDALRERHEVVAAIAAEE